MTSKYLYVRLSQSGINWFEPELTWFDLEIPQFVSFALLLYIYTMGHSCVYFDCICNVFLQIEITET